MVQYQYTIIKIDNFVNIHFIAIYKSQTKLFKDNAQTILCNNCQHKFILLYLFQITHELSIAKISYWITLFISFKIE